MRARLLDPAAQELDQVITYYNAQTCAPPRPRQPESTRQGKK